MANVLQEIQKTKNRYLKLRTKIKYLQADIFFLRRCKKQNVFPNFIQLWGPTNCENKGIIEKAICAGQKMWLNLEIKSKYSKLSVIEREAYSLHLYLSNKLNHEGNNQMQIMEQSSDWNNFIMHVQDTVDCKFGKKKQILIKKFNLLIGRVNYNEQKKIFKEVEPVEDFVKNFSSLEFTTNELELLNRGLNFALQPTKEKAIQSALINIETALKHFNDPDDKVRVRSEAIDKINFNDLTNMTAKMKNFRGAAKSLKEKKASVVFSKADKSNNIVILDKQEYIAITEQFIRTGPYEEVIFNPLPGMIRRTKEAIKQAVKVFNDPNLSRKLNVSNPILPRLYSQLKLHKPGKQIRPITSTTGSILSKLECWLLEKLNNLPIKFETAAIKNGIEFAEKVKNLKIASNEIQVSFDVVSLYPNVPIDETLVFLRKWLERNTLKPEEINEFVKLTKLCMDENWFQFNEKFYRQKFGCSMGSHMSPFLANLFMSHIETEMKNQVNFPRIWLRYVDDIWAIIKKHELRQLINKLNRTKYPSIKFTYEEEIEGKLNFLDLSITRNGDNFELDIYRKPTNTLRYITSDSFHSFEHKMSAFHSMIFRALNIPMTIETKIKEFQKIKDIAKINGYTEELIEDLTIAHRRKQELRNYTTLDLIRNEGNDEKKYSKFYFYPEITSKIKPIFNKYNIRMSECSEIKIKNLIGGSKDKIEQLQKSGIYSIGCNDCAKEYIGQTRRPILKRFKEHFAHLKYNEKEKSSVAEHMLENSHSFSLQNLKLIRNVNSNYELDAFESFYIFKNKNNLMNSDDGPIKDSIFKKFFNRFNSTQL